MMGRKATREEQCQQSWHDLYPNRQRRRDEGKTHLSPYRRFLQTLVTTMCEHHLDTKTYITSSLQTQFYIQVYAEQHPISAIIISLDKHARTMQVSEEGNQTTHHGIFNFEDGSKTIVSITHHVLEKARAT